MSIASIKFPLLRPFRISRGEKIEANLVRVLLEAGGFEGRGECTPYPRYGENADTVIQQLEKIRPQIEQGACLEKVQELLPPGAARNALDCALWDLKARQERTTVAKLLGLSPAEEFSTMRTIVLDDQENMERQAFLLKHSSFLKIKLDQEDILPRLEAVRKGAPNAKIVVDANEAWDLETLNKMAEPMAEKGVVLIEQPLPASSDEALKNNSFPIHICADESCHTTEDLPKLREKYDVINIKLDKTGGLTEAFRLQREGRAQGFKIMLGCMVASSLAIAPLCLLTEQADFIDLDGPLWLKRDCSGGIAPGKRKGYYSVPTIWGG